MRQFKKILGFFGAKVSLSLLLSLGVGSVLFIIEVGFAYSLQWFLYAIGLLQIDSIVYSSLILKLDVKNILIGILVLSVVRGIFRWLQSYSRTYAYYQFTYEIRNRLLRWALNSKSINTSGFLSLWNNRVDHAATFLNSLQFLCSTFATLFGLIVFMSFISWRLTLLGCLIFLLFSVPVFYIHRKIQTLGRQDTKNTRSLNAHVTQTIKNFLLINVYGLKGIQQNKFSLELDKILTSALIFAKYSASTVALVETLGIFLICATTYVGHAYFSTQTGPLVAFFYLFFRLVQGAASFVQSVTSLGFHASQTKELYEWYLKHKLDLENQIQEGHLADKRLTAPAGWKFEDVSFAFILDSKVSIPVFQDLSFSVEPNSIFGISGRSGSGKSTLLSLMVGQLEPQAGRVKLLQEGRECLLSEMKEVLRTSIGFVGPEPLLLAGSIYENLVFGLRKKAKPADVEAAIQRAHCEFIRDLPLGLDHMIDDQGGGLSMGQKQRLSLARALLRSPKMLILDEPTANLDASTEYLMLTSFKDLSRDMTLVIATHKAAVLEIANQQIHL